MGHAAPDLPAGFRSRRHALRPGQQLRASLRDGRSNFGRILATDFVDHRDELVISTKAALSADSITDERLARVRALNEIARRRGQTRAGLALVWALRDPRMTSLVIGASSVRQLDDNIAALQNPSLTAAEIARYGTDAGINPWQQSSDR